MANKIYSPSNPLPFNRVSQSSLDLADTPEETSVGGILHDYMVTFVNGHLHNTGTHQTSAKYSDLKK